MVAFRNIIDCRSFLSGTIYGVHTTTPSASETDGINPVPTRGEYYCWRAMQHKQIILPIDTEIISTLCVGDKLLLTGTLLTARDAAHKRMIEYLDKGDALPFDLSQCPLYYCGPTPAKSGLPIGACGPTTSGRMDSYVERLFAEGLRVMIGKGERGLAVREIIQSHSGLYLIAIGGAGALYGSCVSAMRCIAWDDLGAEAVYELQVKDFPVYVGCSGWRTANGDIRLPPLHS